MSIDLSRVTGISDSRGVITEIKDSLGRVIWSTTIKFTMNGETYEADRGMTWAEWFASDYNTTGETEGDIKDADGNAVSLDAVIVGGTAYEVGFDDGMRTVTVVSDVPGNHSYGFVGIRYNLLGENYYPHYIETAGTYELPVGTYFYFHTSFWSGGSATIYLNGERVGEYSRDEADYYYTLAEDISVSIEAGYNTVIKITET